MKSDSCTKYGDKVQAVTVEGDGWRTRHDLLKMVIAKQMEVGSYIPSV